MLATLNSRQIVDEIVKDTMKDNDPHDAVQISPEVVMASRMSHEAPTLAPDIATRPEPKFSPEPRMAPEPKVSPVPAPQAEALSVDTAVRVTADDSHNRSRRSAAGKWVRGAFVTFLFAGGSAAATIAWENHGDIATQMLAKWTPSLASLLPSTSQTSTSQTAPVTSAQAAPQPAQDQTADQSAPAPAAQTAAAPAAAQPDAAPSVESMTRDMAAMAQQIEQLKASIAELKAGQEQMVRDMAKPSKPIAETKPPINPPARMSALPPRAPSPMPPPVRKPKPVVSHTYMPAYSPPPLAPPPSQAVAAPPPAAPPVASTQTVADDDGPIVRPPMPLH